MTGLVMDSLPTSLKLKPWINCILFSCVLGCNRQNFTLLGGEIGFWQPKTETNSFFICQLLIDIFAKNSKLFY
jgi:hypothetical protein